MLNQCPIAVVDLETDSLCEKGGDICQIACTVIHPRSLEIIPGSEFSSLMRPTLLMTGATAQEIESNWERAQPAFRVNKLKREDLEKAPLPEHVWKSFCNHIDKYWAEGKRKDKMSKPFLAGHNIPFDLKWMQEYANRYGPVDKEGNLNLFNPRFLIDSMQIGFLWWENSYEPENLKLDTFRQYLGIVEDGHDALVDIRTTANIIIRFLKLHREFGKKVKFKGAFAARTENKNGKG